MIIAEGFEEINMITVFRVILSRIKTVHIIMGIMI